MFDPEAVNTKITAIANQKGGVGKTTTAVTLAACLSGKGRKVLLIDFDPQGNASSNLGIDRVAPGSDCYSLISRKTNTPVRLTQTALDKLRVIPSDMNLAGAEIELATAAFRERRLADALGKLLRVDPFKPDHVIIDCPPSLGLLTLNALVAARAVLIPLQCEFFALEGLAHLMRTLKAIRHSLNPSLVVDGILLTMFDRRNTLSELVAADARSFFGASVLDTVIPRNVRISEASSHGQPIILYDQRSPGALAYGRLTDELLRKTPPPTRKGNMNGCS